MAEGTDLLILEGICKSFPGVKALSDVNFSLRAGEIHALVGENGAGKSTLMKILSGAYKKDAGKIIFEGKELEIESPRHAEEIGISIIYQELNLFNNLSVAENIFINRQPRRMGFLNWKEMESEAAELFRQIGIEDIDVRRKVSSYSLAKRQLIEIAKAVSHRSKVVIMDEPTSSLTTQETEVLFNIMRRLRDQGNAVVFISHRMNEIFEITDRLTVLRDGSIIGTRKTSEISRQELISMMIGREFTQQYPPRTSSPGEMLLQVENISDKAGKVHDVSFHVCRGEVVGFAGLVGSGRTETMRAIFGVDPRKSGTIRIDGKEINIAAPGDAIKNKIGFLTEDRKGEGLLLPFSCRYNTTIVALDKIKRHMILDLQAEKRVAEEYKESLHIVTPSMEQRVGQLSGGNQQKVVLAKWLFSDVDIIIMDEPTRGVDVGAKREIYEIINTLTEQNKAVIVVSSEMEEVMGISDRIYVMREGRVTGVLQRDSFSQEEISRYAIGGLEE